MLRDYQQRFPVLLSLTAVFSASCGSPRGQVAQEVNPSLKMQAAINGEGEPLFLVGGGLTGQASWEQHASRLAQTREVARPQLLSVQYGLDNRPLPEDYSIKLESRALAATLDELAPGRELDIVAWSFGALVTLDFALDHPGRIRSLTLIEPPALWLLSDERRQEKDIAELKQMGDRLAQSEDVSEDELETFLRIAGLAPPRGSVRDLPPWPNFVKHRRSLRNTFAVFEHRDNPARLQRLDRPILLVQGTGTSAFLAEIMQVLKQSLPNTETIELPAGHAPQLVSIDRFLDRLEEFLK